jgi:YgiT-type zinc finger domain-containing protein
LSDKECVMGCGGEVEVRTLPTEEITWGQEDSKYGRHVFTIENTRYFHCKRCGEEWLDWQQSEDREQKMNEWLKANIGLDWLKASEDARKTRNS